MCDEFHGGRKHSRRHSRHYFCGRKHHRRRSHRVPPTSDPDDAALTPEERALREAHAVAERKTKLAGDAVWFVGITTLLFIFVPFLGFLVLVFWGFRLAKEVYELAIEPRIRKRFIEQEVEKQVSLSLSRQRRALGGEHARSLERLSASIAHEIRNPITAAKSLVQQMGENPNAAENIEYAHVALEELQRVERSVSHLLRFAREEETGMSEVRMADVIESALETFRDRAERSGITLESRLDRDGAMLGDAEQLRRIIINLVSNAVDALEGASSPDPRIEVQMGENLAGTEVWVQVKDNGPGIDRESLSRMFTPFYTSKVNGTGLGLAISKKLVDAHGGTIEVSSEPGSGAEFLLTLPKKPLEKGGES